MPAGGSGSPLTTTPWPGMSCSEPVGLAEEMMMVVDVGVEIRAPGLDHDLAQQPGRGELMQRVVDGRERHRDRRGERLAVQLLGGDVAIAASNSSRVKRKALASRPQPSRAQTRSITSRRSVVTTSMTEI